MIRQRAYDIVANNCYIFDSHSATHTVVVNSAVDTALRSLEAWGEVLQELQEMADEDDASDYKMGVNFGLMLAAQVITSKIHKVEDTDVPLSDFSEIFAPPYNPLKEDISKTERSSKIKKIREIISNEKCTGHDKD